MIVNAIKVVSHWCITIGDLGYNLTYDQDHDDDIDIVDIMLVVKHWGETCG